MGRFEEGVQGDLLSCEPCVVDNGLEVMRGSQAIKVAAILGAWSCLLPFPLSGYPAPTIQESLSDELVFSRCPALRDFIDRDDWRSRLLNPIIRSAATVEGTAEEYRQVLVCVGALPTSLSEPEWLPLVRYHMGLFLSFAGSSAEGESTSTRQLVDLSATPDPAVIRLREGVGLPAPEGLVIVRYFARRELMPERVRYAFESPQTQAVTMSSRYVAVLTASPRNLSGARIIPDALQTTFSHEMVHAFLNAGLDWNVAGIGFPRWFHEGMAIHFSGSGRGHVEVDPRTGGLRRTEPTTQYERYARVFEYLEADLGQPRFHAAVREAVGNADAALLIAASGEASYEDLVARAELWWRWWPLPPALVTGSTGFFVLGSILAVAALLAAAWWRWQPAIPGSALEVGLNGDLLRAVRAGDVEEVQYLLKSGADIDAADSRAWTVLQWAVWFDLRDITEALLNHGARVTPEIQRLADAGGRSPHIVRMLADAAAKYESESKEL